MTLPQLLPLQTIRPLWNMQHLTSTAQSIQIPDICPMNELIWANVRCKFSTKVNAQKYFSISQSRLQLRLHPSFRTLNLRKEEPSLPRWEDEIDLQPLGMKLPFLRYVKRGVNLPEMRNLQLKSNSDTISSPNPGLQSSDAFSNISLAAKTKLEKSPEHTIEMASGGSPEQSSYPKENNEFKLEGEHLQGKTAGLRQDLVNSAGNNSQLKANKFKSLNATKEKKSTSRNPSQSHSIPLNESHSNIQVKTPYKSLYDELFPEEDEEVKVRYKQAVIRMETLPIFDWNPKNTRIASKKMFNSAQKYQHDIKSHPIAKYDQIKPLVTECLSLLSLDGCSCSLEESDFFRLGPKGEHIQMWTAGIIKVIPMRDELTLRAKGSYILLFSGEDTARAYRDEIIRIHRLSKNSSNDSSIVPSIRPDDLRDGETLDALLKDYSLVPGYSRLCLRLLKRPFNPQFKQILTEGGPVAYLKRQTASDYLVLLYLDIGNISMKEIQDFVTEDGKRRNLYWRLVGGPDAIYEVNKKTELEELPSKDDGRKNPPPRPSSYVLPFLNEYEARRFVREWHRRQFPFPGRRFSEYINHPIINAEILW